MMCLPFFHKWNYEFLKEIRVWESMNDGVPAYFKYVFIGRCEKCGSVKQKIFRS